jgi:hypothetical protein
MALADRPNRLLRQTVSVLLASRGIKACYDNLFGIETHGRFR